MLSVPRFSVVTLLLLSVIACVHVPPRGRQQYRRDQYFATQRELSPAIANAIETGHVVAGMDREQVWVVVGDPVKKSLFPGAHTEVWLYPSARFHQDPALAWRLLVQTRLYRRHLARH